MGSQTPGSTSRRSTVLCESFYMEGEEWPEVTLICGSLGVVLGFYGQNTEVEVKMDYCGQETTRDFPVQLPSANLSDQSVGGYLADVAEKLCTRMPDGADPTWFRPAALEQQQGTTSSANHFSSKALEVKIILDEETVNSRPCPIWISCNFKGARPSLSAEFDESSHEAKFVDRLLCQISHISKQLSSPNTLLRDVNLLSSKDERDIRRWTPTPVPLRPSCVHELVETQFLMSPDASAVHSWDGSLTYRELHEASSRVAVQLLEANVPRKSVIPLLFEKSMWTVVAMMAVLKSGHAFLLLDASHPTGRLELLTLDVKGPIILSSEAQKDRAARLAPSVISVSSSTVSGDAIVTAWDQEQITIEPFDLALVVYTSGTTGRPKATAIEHHSICSGLTGLADLAGISETCRYYQFSSYAWDAAFGEILMTLFSGGCICIPSEEDRMNRLSQSMTSLNANSVLLTPTVLRLLSPREVPTMRNIIMGGEKVTKDLIQTWKGHASLTTVYAPAECTVACMVNQQFGDEFDPALIGSSFGCRVWLTVPDDINRLAPVGVAGELIIEGSNVARGYLNDGEKTAKSFLTTSPAWMTAMQIDRLPHSRFYRTGDLARYTPDGKVVFVGRRDFQVKLRGQRIELEEVQSQIQRRLRLPGAQVFVDVMETVADLNLPSLTAFVHIPQHQSEAYDNQSLAENMAAEYDSLQLALTDVLPEFMVPTIWIPLPVVPLSSSGKLDRSALRQAGRQYLLGLKSIARKTETLSEAQQHLSQLWERALTTTQRPGLTDNFFLLGGDSVKAMRLVSLARQANLELSVRDIFQHPTLSAMCSKTKPISHSNKLVISSAFSMLSKEDLSRSSANLKSLGFEEEDIVDVFPCSQLQESMFSFSLSVPGSYISQYVFPIGRGAAAENLKKALEDTVAAVPILRTRILLGQKNFNQVIIKDSLQWTHTQQPLDEFLETDRQGTFDIGETLTRYCIIDDMESGEVHLVWTLHHSIFDGWSIERIFERVRSRFEERDTSEDEDELDRDFAKFVQFSRNTDTEYAREFWLHQLHDAPMPSFPAIRADNAQIADRSCITESMAISQFSKPGITVTILARAGLALLLSQYENSEDVVFGNTVHGRSSLPLQLHNVLGPTLATLPVRVRVDKQHTISRFLADLQDQFVATIPYEQYGLLRIRGINQETRASSSFRVLLIVQNPESTLSLGGNFEGREAFRCLHEYPLVITVTPTPTRVNTSWTFDENCVSEEQVGLLALQFKQTLAQLCTMPDITELRDLDLASETDKVRIFDWNAVHHKPVNTSGIELFRKQIERDPEALAIDAWDGNLNYAALDKVSDAFASEMVRLGVKQNTLVGHCFEKSRWAPVALISILKAGGAFAPFPPGYPKERLLSFTRDAGIRLIICSRQQRDSLSSGPWEILVADEETQGSFLQRPATLLPTSIRPESLIYALQTSGTTGQPKTFTVRHTAFATGAVTRAPWIRRGTGMRVLQFGPYTFRLGIENILATLTAGGCICIPSDDAIMNDLSGYMKEARINFANVTPSVARTLAPLEVPDLEVLLVSGEPPDRDLVAKWAGHVQLVNGYGPSEFAAKQTLNFAMTEDDPQNLGRPVGASLWVVDPDNHERLSPLGAVGELLIEGPTLADGYINRPAEMSKWFISTPSWLRAFRTGKTVVFKSGDLVRYNPDGSLTSVGRADGQVKLHGQRFEAKEVEHHVRTVLADVQLHVLVDVIRFKGHESDVVAAFVALKEHKLQSTMELDPALSRKIQGQKHKISESLSRFLPGYMVPKVFVGVSIIPVTANGKADRRALKAFGSQLPFSWADAEDGASVVRPPSSDMERLLHGLWQKVLGLDSGQLGLDNNFFELGGSSMSAIRLVAMAREANLSLVAQSIFKYPVLQDMALQLDSLDKRDSNLATARSPRFSLLREIGCSLEALTEELSVHGLTENDVEDAYPCLHLQGFYMKKAVVFPGSTTYQHVYELPEGTDVPRLELAIECVWKASPSLRTRVISVSGKLVQVVCREDFVFRHFERLEECHEEDQKVSWAMGAPLSRFSIVAGDKERHLPPHLVWTSSHVVWDQWSRIMMLEDIDNAYQSGCLPYVRPCYRDFVAHVCQQSRLGVHLTSSLLRDEYLGRQFTSRSTVGWTEYRARNSARMVLTLDLPVIDKLSVSHSSLLLSCWTLAVAVVEDSNAILTVNEINGRGSSFPGVEKLAAPVVAAVPLCVAVQPGTMSEHAALVQKHTTEGLALQHSVALDNQLLSQIESSVYWVLVNDQDGHEEPATTSLGLRRNRAEKIAIGVWPFYLTFNVHPGNSKVELEAILDEELVPFEKAAKLFACLKYLLAAVFAPGGLNLNTEEVHMALKEVLQNHDSTLSDIKASISFEKRFRDFWYNPYSETSAPGAADETG
ncbi:hypothetical protein KVR01_003874 [Diaporthe batatas]|uniref:uncharacterized protein n=1 Tax=Diaporthe batatas TaxID=748121 RepID=UPI001D03D590|nr:uncharacterized protein KVR01_003874 [Diaporthe batatas]KAG8168185.1 hypothetical protein KVR01_003874 [Diaporthe batatas]